MTMTSIGGLAAIAAFLVVLGCSGGGGADSQTDSVSAAGTATAGPATTTRAEETAETEAAPAGERLQAAVGGVEFTYVAPDPERFRLDTGVEGAQHWLPVDVAGDPQAERWGDWFLFAPTVIHDPKTQETEPLPDDPIGWLRDHPKVKVLDERETKVDGRPAHVVDVNRQVNQLFGSDDLPAPEGEGFERYVFWQVDDTWLIAEASTFRGRQGLAEKDTPDDPFLKYLGDLRFE